MRPLFTVALLALALLGSRAAAQDFGPPGFGGAEEEIVAVGDVTFDPPAVAPGGETTLVVEILMAEDWHIYSAVPLPGQTPTAITLETEGLAAAGKIKEPVPTSNHGQLYHEGAFKLRLPVKVDASLSGEIRVKARMDFMACNSSGCRPPESKILRAVLRVGDAPAAAAPGGDDEVVVGPIGPDTGFISFTVAASPATAKPGDVVTVEVRGEVPADRWTYSAVKPAGLSMPTTVEFEPSDAYEVLEEIEESEAHLHKAVEEWDQDSWHHTGSFTIRRKLRLKEGASGRVAISGKIEGQTCDQGGCVNHEVSFRLAIQAGEKAAGGGAGAEAGVSSQAVEGLHRRIDDVEEMISKLLPKPVPPAPQPPAWNIEGVEFEVKGTPRAGERTPISVVFRTPEPVELGASANVFVDVLARNEDGKWATSKRVQSVEAVKAESDEDGLVHRLELELLASDVAARGEETLKLDLSVPLVVGGHEFDFETKDLQLGLDFGLPNFWDWVLRAIGAALLALLTPCVFPMIPVTVSYFTKQAGEGAKSAIFLPTVYALGIVVSFIAIGVLFTLATNATGANTLATNGYAQAAFGVLFVVFAFSLFGLFTLRPPSFLMAKAGSVQGKGGLVGVLGMGLLFSLTTFTCTAPLVGLILVAASESGDWLMPIIGMAAFAATLAAPFFLLALFPKLVSGLPKSGGWLNKVKVTLGFIELAFALKFFGAMDAYFGWGLFTREAILWMWVVMFIMNGLFLLNFVRFDKYDEYQPAGPLTGAVAVALLIFGAHLVSGARGADALPRREPHAALARPRGGRGARLGLARDLQERLREGARGGQGARRRALHRLHGLHLSELPRRGEPCVLPEDRRRECDEQDRRDLALLRQAPADRRERRPPRGVDGQRDGADLRRRRSLHDEEARPVRLQRRRGRGLRRAAREGESPLRAHPGATRADRGEVVPRER
ncbi:MAG: cytochrome c biogenesis protein CcdA [Planctomycetota bacterium]